MEKVRNFHEKLEADIKRLMVRTQERKILPAKEAIPSREVLRESLKVYAEEMVPPAPPTPAADSGDDSTRGILPDYAGGGAVPAAVKLEVERLLDLVFERSLDAGIREAKKHPPFVQDAFHDALVDKLLPELEKRGLIK